VAVGKVIAELLLVVPLVPADGLVVVPAPPVEAQFVVEGANATLAYAPPVTSVPPPASVGVTVYKPMNRAAGAVNATPRKQWSINLFSSMSDIADIFMPPC
jgi:hypothetical protein